VAAAFPRVDVAASAAHAIRHGQRIPAAGIDGTYGVFGPDGRVLALARDSGRAAKSVVVLDPA
jgi:tRNA pseudouridine55 synthase